MGVSDQTGLPDDLNQSLLWTHEIQGGGVPVIAGGRAYQFGYYGVEDDLQEALVCFDAATGKVLWERRHSDFVSDIVYNRYGVGAACIDPASGNVYFQTSPGLLIGYDSEGNQLWERSLMEEFARLTRFQMAVREGLVWTAIWSSFMPSRRIGKAGSGA